MPLTMTDSEYRRRFSDADDRDLYSRDERLYGADAPTRADAEADKAVG